jgi:hypothetical protein
MPLLPGVENIGHNIREMQRAGHKYSQALAASLRAANVHKKAFGGGIGNAAPPWYIRNEARQMNNPGRFGGALSSTIPGRTDHIPLKVRKGSYVLPADTVSALGQGNSAAGHSVLNQMFKTGPFGMPAPIRSGKSTMPKAPSMGRPPSLGIGDIKPGKLGFADGGETGDVDVMAAGGEHILTPEQVTSVGGGDIDHGHKILDEFVKHVRSETVKTLRKLPGPKRD